MSDNSQTFTDTISSESVNENQNLLNPMDRSDVIGKDEDLEAIEEFYLKEIEQSVNADLILQVKKEESQILSQIEEEK